MRQPEGLKWWYLKVIAQIAKANEVQTALIQGLSWGEVDYPADLIRAERLAEAWEKRG
jgi:choline kinase